MLVKIIYDGSKTLYEIARFCGCAPCQILAVNNLKSELELKHGQQIEVPVIIKSLIHLK